MLGVLPNSKGGQIYKTLAESAGGEANLSKALNEAGIPGIRYFDGSSRNVPNPDPAHLRAAKSFADSGSSLDDAVKGMQQAYPDAKPQEVREALAAVGLGRADLGTRNIVVFDESAINKVKRDGEEVFNRIGK
jgi:hypothetical protein